MSEFNKEDILLIFSIKIAFNFLIIKLTIKIFFLKINFAFYKIKKLFPSLDFFLYLL